RRRESTRSYRAIESLKSRDEGAVRTGIWRPRTVRAARWWLPTVPKLDLQHSPIAKPVLARGGLDAGHANMLEILSVQQVGDAGRHGPALADAAFRMDVHDAVAGPSPNLGVGRVAEGVGDLPDVRLPLPSGR